MRGWLGQRVIPLDKEASEVTPHPEFEDLHRTAPHFALDKPLF